MVFFKPTILVPLLTRPAFLAVGMIATMLCVVACGDSQTAEGTDGRPEGAAVADTAASQTPALRVNLDSLGRLPAFSHATTVGNLVFVSGTLGTKPKSIDLVSGGVGAQTTQTMSNIKMILEEAGSSIEQIAKCIVYLTDMGDFASMNEAWIAAVGPSPPARATIGVKELALGAVVEIECTAAR